MKIKYLLKKIKLVFVHRKQRFSPGNRDAYLKEQRADFSASPEDRIFSRQLLLLLNPSSIAEQPDNYCSPHGCRRAHPWTTSQSIRHLKENQDWFCFSCQGSPPLSIYLDLFRDSCWEMHQCYILWILFVFLPALQGQTHSKTQLQWSDEFTPRRICGSGLPWLTVWWLEAGM